MFNRETSGMSGGRSLARSAFQGKVEDYSVEIIGYKPLNFFKDINPEIVYITVFDNKIAYQEGDKALFDLPSTDQAIIDKAVMQSMLESPKKMFSRPLKDGKCFAVNQLHNPKGYKQICELCSKGATLCCSKCTVTYYCSWEHCERDSSHDVVCEKIKIIRWPTPHRQCSIERRREKAMKILVMEMLLDDLAYQSYYHLAKKRYRHAYGTLLQCFKYVAPVYGDSHESSQMITLYTAMADVYIGLGKFEFADRMLQNALSMLWREVDAHKEKGRPINFIHAMVSKIQGLFYSAMGDHSKALSWFSEYVVDLTEAVGASNVRICMGFLLLAKTFIALGKTSEGSSMLEFSVNLWLYYLVDRMSYAVPDFPRLAPSIYFDAKDDIAMTRFIKLEFLQFFTGIYEFVDETSNSTLVAKIHMCEAMMSHLERNYRQMKDHVIRSNDLLHHTAANMKLKVVCKQLLRLYRKKVVNTSSRTSILH